VLLPSLNYPNKHMQKSGSGFCEVRYNLREWTGVEWLDTSNNKNERLTFTVDADSCIGCIGTFKWEWQSRDYGCGTQCGAE
jgi:hypothetical protein